MGLVDCGTDCKDTADEIADLKDCLFSTVQRARIALVLIDKGETDCLPTILEDLFYGTQLILDNFCVEKG